MRTRIVIFPALFLILTLNCLAQVPAVTSFSGGHAFTTIGIPSSNLTVGWTFTANANIAVSALGFWEFDTGILLQQTHQVGLWNSSGIQLGQVTIEVNSAATGNWRYVAFGSPVALVSGQTYYVGATVDSPFNDVYERVDVLDGSVVASGLISVGRSVVSGDASGFAFPSTIEPSFIARFGPNLLISAISPPTISKSFNPTTVPVNGTSVLGFTVTNPDAVIGQTGIAFTDNLPAGLVVSNPNGLTGNCGGGTITAVAGSATVSLAGAALATGASCSFSVNVTPTSAGAKVNTTGTIASIEGGTGATSTSTLTAIASPTFAKSFSPTTTSINGLSALSFTITNPNAGTAISNIAFTDTLPAGLVVSTPNGQTGSCGAGTITAVAGSGSVSLSGATLAASGSCTFAVNVTPSSAGAKLNTTGNITSTEGGTGSPATATLTVLAVPTITKSFTPNGIAVNGTSALSFTITNPNAGNSISGVGFTDSFPAGVVVKTPNGLSGSCGGGTITATAGAGSVSLSGATLAASASCTFSVNVTSTTAGTKVNTTGNVTSTDGGSGSPTSATLTVNSSPTITKSFSPASILVNGTSTLSFTITNGNAGTTVNAIAFTDTLPAGLVVSNPNGLSGPCGGGTITATAGSGSVGLSGATLAAGASCTFSVSVTATSGGTKVNTTGALTSTEGGTGGTSNTATLTVIVAPTISASFTPASVPVNGTSSFTFVVSNPNAGTSLTGVGFTDALPAGLLVSTPNGQSGSCGAGTITATAGSGNLSLSGATLAANSSCTFSVNVTASTAGSKSTTTSNVTSNEGGTGNAASATLGVGAQSVPMSPTTLLMIGAGLAVLAFLQLRRRRFAPTSR
jgi:uncharacterized repeat protein (TIGR01451 family)